MATVTEFKISVDRRESARKTSTLDKRRAEFRLFRQLLSKVPQENVFVGVGVIKNWSLFRHYIPKAQEQAIPKCWKSSR